MNTTDPLYQDGPPPEPTELPPEVIVSSDTLRKDRVPPGQSRTRKWPVLDAHGTPDVSREEWTLTIDGLVETPLQLDWNQFQSLPRVKVFADFHCVTRWSRLGNLWEGVSTRELAQRAGVRPEAKFVVATGYDYGWTTNLPLADFLAPDALVTDLHDGEPIAADHGGPVRLMIPLLYAWKSAKWLKKITFLPSDAPGFWEQMGYHNHGDPWTEERHGW